MTQTASPHTLGLWYPNVPLTMMGVTPPGLQAVGSIDATGEKIMMAGYVVMQGSPSGSKTVSSSGGSIAFLINTATWATSGSTIRVGLQDADTTTSPAVPDGTFDVYADLVQGTDTLTANTWKSVAMSSGSKSLTHGDRICVVLDMTARSGSDALSLVATGVGAPQISSTVRNYTTSWQNALNALPNVLITCDDGTLCVLSSGTVHSSVGTIESWQDSTNPDERGALLYVPWNCTVDAMRYYVRTQGNANADYDVRIYSDPLGTPSQLLSVSVEGAFSSVTVSSTRESEVVFAPVTLTPGWYALVLKATGSASIGMSVTSVADASYKSLFGLCSKITRNNETGAFTESATDGYMGFSLSLSSIDDGAGGGGGGNTYSRGRVVNG